jgi:hypothetical protein
LGQTINHWILDDFGTFGHVDEEKRHEGIPNDHGRRVAK